jgi:hypothetical protein
VPAVNGALRAQQASADYVESNKAELMAGASKAVAAKIFSHDGAAKAMATTMANMARAKEEAQSTFRPGGGLPTAESAATPAATPAD